MAAMEADVAGIGMPKLGPEAGMDPHQMQAVLASMCMGGNGMPPPMPPDGMATMQAYMQQMVQLGMQGMPPQGPVAGAVPPPMPFPGMLPPPFMSPSMTQTEPTVSVSVEGMKFQYQLTEEDLQKVFSRYGKVEKIKVDENGSAAKITFSSVAEAQNVMGDLDGKVLNGLDGKLKIQWCNQPTTLPSTGPAVPPPSLPGTQAPAYAGGWLPWGMPPNSTAPPQSMGQTSLPMPTDPKDISSNGVQQVSSPVPGQGSAAKGVRKYTCRFLIGIENDKDFQVARRIIGAKGLNMKKIVRTTEAKLRLRGQGSGYFEGAGHKESPEPLQLCISCTTAEGYWSAVRQVQDLLKRVYDEYKQYCAEQGKPVPDLEINLSENQLVYSSSKGDSLTFGESTSDTLATPKKEMETKARRSARSGAKTGKPNAEVDKGAPGPNAPPVDVIERLIDERNEARRSCNFAEADRIRQELHRCGVALMDEPGGRGKGAEVTAWRYWRD